MADLAESEHVYRLLPFIKKSQFPRDCVIEFDLRKVRTVKLGVPSSECYLVSG